MDTCTARAIIGGLGHPVRQIDPQYKRQIWEKQTRVKICGTPMDHRKLMEPKLRATSASIHLRVGRSERRRRPSILSTSDRACAETAGKIDL